MITSKSAYEKQAVNEWVEDNAKVGILNLGGHPTRRR